MLLSDQQKYIISVLKQVKYIRLRQLYSLTVQHYRKERFEISQHRMDVMLRQLRTGTNFVYFQEDVVCYGKRTVDERYLEAVDVMLGLELGHIGINCENEAEAAKTAETIGSLLSMAVKPGNSSIFVGKKEFEIMKKPGRGTHGHIAILTNNVDRAIYHLGQRGVKFDMDSKNVKDGKTVAIYFADEVAGFAIHLVQK